MPRYFYLCPGPTGCGYRSVTPGPCIVPGCASGNRPMVDIEQFSNGATTYDGPWIPRVLCCFICGAELDTPGPCPMPACVGRRLEDASDAEFVCTCCLSRQRKAGVCETAGCEKVGRPLWEFSQRTFDPPAEERLADLAYVAESRRRSNPS